METQVCACVVYSCVLADMCLSSSDGGDELNSRAKLLCLLDSVTDSLVWAIARRGINFQQQSTRLAHLLMLLSHIRHVRYDTRHRRDRVCTALPLFNITL